VNVVSPQKLKAGDEVRVIAPAKSFREDFVKNKLDKTIEYFKNEFGIKITLGKYVFEVDEFDTASKEHRLEDFHNAIADQNVKGILTVLGGTNSNQLLKYIDYDLVAKNPKVFCGLSDITVVVNAIYSKTGIITYYGPHFTVFGKDQNLEYTKEYFRKTLFSSEPFVLKPSSVYFDSRSGKEEPIENTDGYWVIQEGMAEGYSVGGNMVTLNLLQGSEYYPSLKGKIVFVEDNNKENFRAFENHLQALILQKDFDSVRGLIIGRFQKESGVTRELLEKLIATKKELKNLPIIANVDFGHTVPMVTLPIGGYLKMSAQKDNPQIFVDTF